MICQNQLLKVKRLLSLHAARNCDLGSDSAWTIYTEWHLVYLWSRLSVPYPNPPAIYPTVRELKSQRATLVINHHIINPCKKPSPSIQRQFLSVFRFELVYIKGGAQYFQTHDITRTLVVGKDPNEILMSVSLFLKETRLFVLSLFNGPNGQLDESI